MTYRVRRAVAVAVVALVAVATALSFSPGAQAAPPPRTDHCRNGYVALTFDDGPSSTTIPILRVLRAAKAKATFFNVGANEQAYPALVRLEKRAGMRFGNHTYSHPFMTELDPQAAYDEMLGTQQIHQQITGDTLTLYRPPFGLTSPELRAMAASLGMTEVLWTVDTQDWSGISAADIVASALTVQPGGIVLMHDEGYQSTVTALPLILKGLAAQGLCPGGIYPSAEPVTAWEGMTFYAAAGRW